MTTVTTRNPTLLVFLPTFNEADNIGRMLTSLSAHAPDWPGSTRVVVMDDGSCDDTVEIAEGFRGSVPVSVVRRPHEGLGATLLAGVRLAVADEALDYLVTLEADSTGDLDAIPRMLCVAADGADVVQGSSHHPEGGLASVQAGRGMASRAANLMLRHATGMRLHTFTHFQRVLRVAALRRSLELHGDHLVRETGFAGVAELVVTMGHDGAQIVEVPITHDGSRRVGPSRMPIASTVGGELRMAGRFALGRALGRT